MPIAAFDTVAVLGLGTMGHGIAQTFAAAGYTVRCWDELPGARASLHERVRGNLQAFVRAGLVAPAAVEPILSRLLVAANDSAALADAGFVTEAVKEDLAVKQELFARFDTLAPPGTILASNSSSFPISQSAARMQRPERAVVTHWFNPPHLVPTVEVVPGPQTSEATTQTTLALLADIGKQPVRLRLELPGFLVNRVQVAVQREVWDLLERGVASAEEIDAAIRGSMGFRLAAVGPLEVHDFGGLDIQTTTYRNLAPDLRSDSAVPDLVQRLVDEGHLGTKTGRGLYDYPPGRVEERRARRDALFLALAKLLDSSAEGEPS
jgi:3-hydroxybutyryl-CoA dehydrogenase